MPAPTPPDPRLPRVLVTEVVRSAHQGDSHGGAYLVDLASGNAERVLDWNRMDIEWEGRGQGRGLRGIEFYDGLVYIAASDELFVFDPQFKIVKRFRNRYLGHCHEIFRADDTLYLTSTNFDSVLAFDLRAERFIRGYLVRYAPGRSTAGGRVLRVGRFDPTRRDGPKPGDTTHLNNVLFDGGRVLVSGVRLRSIVSIGRTEHAETLRTPEWTHNAQPCGDGVLYNSTGEDEVCLANAEGEVIRRFPIVTYDPAELTHTDLPDDYARQGFARGLVTTTDGLLLAGSSPSTVTAWDFANGERLATVNFGMDIRNAPHGLAVWPF